MALIEKELEIVKLEEILRFDLKIPTYQRPYRWNPKTAVTLFQDVKQAYQEGKNEYRMGTVIIHKSTEGNYNIVDGQQRLTTLCLLKYCLTGEEGCLFNQEYNSLSKEAIINNYKILKQKVANLKEDRDSYTKFLLKNCTLVKLVIDSEQEAFQFFDSQNSRGKPLYPHDLLKSYHLREMRKEKEEEKITLMNQWENIKEEELEGLFTNKLFPIIQWYKGGYGLHYSSEKIEIFKGINKEFTYPYVKYHISANTYQLTQPVVAGRGFFEYILYYYNMLQKTEEIIKERIPNKYKEFYHKKGRGYGYTKNLFINSIILFVDRFGEKSLTNDRIEILFQWAYSLRIVMQSVYQETMNNYAIGKETVRINKGLNLFEAISKMKKPEELEIITLETIEEKDFKLSKDRRDLYDCIYKEGKER